MTGQKKAPAGGTAGADMNSEDSHKDRIQDLTTNTNPTPAPDRIAGWKVGTHAFMTVGDLKVDEKFGAHRVRHLVDDILYELSDPNDTVACLFGGPHGPECTPPAVVGLLSADPEARKMAEGYGYYVAGPELATDFNVFGGEAYALADEIMAAGVETLVADSSVFNCPTGNVGETRAWFDAFRGMCAASETVTDSLVVCNPGRAAQYLRKVDGYTQFHLYAPNYEQWKHVDDMPAYFFDVYPAGESSDITRHVLDVGRDNMLYARDPNRYFASRAATVNPDYHQDDEGVTEQ